MEEEHKEYYDRLRDKIKNFLSSEEGQNNRWADYILMVPDFFYLLAKLSFDANVPTREKMKIIGVLAYFISPIDVMPEAIMGPLGFLDDIALTAYVLNSLLNSIDDELIKKYWKGEEDLYQTVRNIIEFADEMVGSGFWGKLKLIINRLV